MGELAVLPEKQVVQRRNPQPQSRRGHLATVKDGIIVGIYQARSLIMETAKIFWSGRSQAVRLPKEFRFEADEVRIRRHGSGVILEPVARDWAWLDEIIGPADDDFAGGVREQPAEQERPALDYLK